MIIVYTEEKVKASECMATVEVVVVVHLFQWPMRVGPVPVRANGFPFGKQIEREGERKGEREGGRERRREEERALSGTNDQKCKMCFDDAKRTEIEKKKKKNRSWRKFLSV